MVFWFLTKEGRLMFSLTESKLQGWRALAVAEDRTEHLVYLGRSSAQVRNGYAAAFLDLLDDDERAQIKHIALQRWEGAADEGRWIQQAVLPIPMPKAERVLAQSA
jgi:hypothetical protein